MTDDRTVEDLWAEIAEQHDIDTSEKIDPADTAAAFERPGTQADFLLTITDDDVVEALLSGDLMPGRRSCTRHSARSPTSPCSTARPRDRRGRYRQDVVVVHRAKFLADQLLHPDDEGRPDKDGRVLVATHTKALPGSLQARCGSSAPPGSSVASTS